MASIRNGSGERICGTLPFGDVAIVHKKGGVERRSPGSGFRGDTGEVPYAGVSAGIRFREWKKPGPLAGTGLFVKADAYLEEET